MKEKIIETLSKDPVMKELVLEFGLIPPAVKEDVYLSLLDSIVSQQLSVKVADIIFLKFLKLFPDEYPTPELLLQMDNTLLRTAGLSNAKSNYVKAVAEHYLKNIELYKNCSVLSDQDLSAFLCDIKGVGEWTAQMILIFTLGRENIFPIKDLAIRQTVMELYNVKTYNEKRLLKIAEKWAPYKSYGSRLIWRWKDTKKKIQS
jgi:DNA-3-methyladenine glycosylase II